MYYRTDKFKKGDKVTWEPRYIHLLADDEGKVVHLPHTCTVLSVDNLPEERWAVSGHTQIVYVEEDIAQFAPAFSGAYFQKYVGRMSNPTFRDGIEAAAKLIEDFPEKLVRLYHRPGGPPGNRWYDPSRSELAAAIRAINPPDDKTSASFQKSRGNE